MHSPSKDVGPKDIENNMNMAPDTRKSNFVNQEWLRFHIWFIMTLYYKMRQILIQNATKVHYKMRQLLYYKMQHFYYKLRQLLQNTSISLQNATVTTKSIVY